MTVRRPRVRELTARFDSKGLPLFMRRTQEVRMLLPERYLHRLSSGDCELALRGLLGIKNYCNLDALRQQARRRWTVRLKSADGLLPL